MVNNDKWEFQTSKTEMKETFNKALSVQHMKTTHENSALTFIIPDDSHYDAFIQRLISKNLLPLHPTPGLEKEHATRSQAVSSLSNPIGGEQADKPTAPTSFDKVPRPKNSARE